MASILSTRNVVCILIICCSLIFNTYGRTDPSFRVKAVNLGGWLVTEGWIKPSLFDGIVNRDFMVSTVCIHTLLTSLPFTFFFFFFLNMNICLIRVSLLLVFSG